ncbi:MAG: EAL domain-containing protein [Hyphomicrobiales bacterium]|nr:EAL domain-containing protein [Hyphomicrobiales bacterium]
MRRFADLFIATCIPIVAAAAGAIAHWQFAAGGATSFAVMGVALLALVTLRWATTRRVGGTDGLQIEYFDRRIGGLAADFDALERRIEALEAGRRDTARDEIDQMVAEIEVIGTLTRQVIEAVADLEVQFAEAREAAIIGGGAKAAPVTPQATPRPARSGPRSPLVPERFADLDEDQFLALVRRAIDADRIDVHLQPIVGLPQRKIRYYESLSRLRGDDGETIHPSDYIPIAEARGYMAAIDEQILLKSMAILRRLAERSREIGVFLNLSAASLGHPGFFRDFLAFMEKNRDLADMLVLEFPQAAVRAMGPIEQEGMRALKEIGFRFSVDQVGDLKISFQNMADRGFRFVKISADRLLHRADELGADIHPVDLTDYFRRFGMELIADHVEREAEVIDLLDYGVRLGQGNLFAPPRPVRVDLSTAERTAGALARAAQPSRTAEAERGRGERGAAEAAAAETRAKPGRGDSPAARLSASLMRSKRAPERATPTKPAGEAEPRAGIRIVPPGVTSRS